MRACRAYIPSCEAFDRIVQALCESFFSAGKRNQQELNSTMAVWAPWRELHLTSGYDKPLRPLLQEERSSNAVFLHTTSLACRIVGCMPFDLESRLLSLSQLLPYRHAS